MELLLVNGEMEAARMGDRPAPDRAPLRSRQNLRRHAGFHCIIQDVEDAVPEGLLVASRKLGDEETVRQPGFTCEAVTARQHRAACRRARPWRPER